MSKPYQLETADNGLQLLRVAREGTEAASVAIFFNVGSRYESTKTNGLAHFVEHMVFKGSKEYPTTAAISNPIDRIGGYLNAWTSAEATAFYVKAAADKVAVPLEILSSMVTTPLYDKDELDKERGVILEEINMYEDEPRNQLARYLDEVTYPDHPIGRATLGTPENIKSFPRKFFADYTKQYFTPDRAILVVSGNLTALDEAKLQAAAARFTGQNNERPEPAPQDLKGRRFGVIERPSEQSHLGIALTAAPLSDRQKTTRLEVLSTILGGNVSSRLFMELRERQGLCYYISSAPDQLTDAGTMTIFAGVTNEKIGDAFKGIFKELKKLKDGDLSDDELAMGKESLKGSRALRLEDSFALGSYYGLQQLLLGEIWTPHQVFDEIDSVTKDEVLELANEMFTDDNLSAAVVGPQKQTKLDELVHF